MSNIRRLDDGGPLIPPKSRYEVKIEAPKALELVPYVGGIMNGSGSKCRSITIESTSPPTIPSMMVSGGSHSS